MLRENSSPALLPQGTPCPHPAGWLKSLTGGDLLNKTGCWKRSFAPGSTQRSLQTYYLGYDEVQPGRQGMWYLQAL